jgi:hypothetical protein
LEVSGQLLALASLLLGKEPPVLTGWEAGWASEAVWMMCRGEKSCSYWDSNSNPLTVQPVASHYTDYTFLAPTKKIKEGKRYPELWKVHMKIIIYDRENTHILKLQT